MSSYKNCMESMVEEMYDELKPTLNCCTCQRCRDDTVAYALNHLPCRYVVSDSGSLFARANALERQYRTDIIAALQQAADVVAQYPRHSLRRGSTRGKRTSK